MKERWAARRLPRLGAAFVLLGSWSCLSGVALAERSPRVERPGTGCRDGDGDLYGEGCALGPDCDDSDGSVSPAATERCDGRDNDCDGAIDDLAGCDVAPPSSEPVVVPAGQYTMGSEIGEGHRDEWPPHQVDLDRFVVDRTEVTNGAYQQCVEAGACAAPAEAGSATRDEYYEDPEYEAYPVIHVTWQQAQQYCQWRGGRLPTEAEWEATARGPGDQPRQYPWGDLEPDCSLANFGGPGGCAGDTDEVGRRPAGASPFGALDMAGNVWEWTNDWYDSLYYNTSPEDDPQGPASGSHRVIRGGCWESGVDSLRVSCRNAALPSAAQRNIGFRCAYDVAPQPPPAERRPAAP
jgi:formylglycine-generating enzyme required for sulfatase activity